MSTALSFSSFSSSLPIVICFSSRSWSVLSFCSISLPLSLPFCCSVSSSSIIWLFLSILSLSASFCAVFESGAGENCFSFNTCCSLLKSGISSFFSSFTGSAELSLIFSSTAAVTSTDGFLKNLYKPRGTTSFVFIIVTLSPNSAFASAIASSSVFPIYFLIITILSPSL